MSQLILQHFVRFSYVTGSSLTSPGFAHYPNFPSFHLRHSPFSNPSVALRTPQLILQSSRCFTYVTAHSPTLLLLHLRHSSFSNPSFASLTSQALPLTSPGSAHSPTFPSLHLRHSSFPNLSVALPTPKLIFQSFRCSTYVTAHSPTILSLLLRYRLFP